MATGIGVALADIGAAVATGIGVALADIGASVSISSGVGALRAHTRAVHIGARVSGTAARGRDAHRRSVRSNGALYSRLRSIPSFGTPEPPGRMCTMCIQRSESCGPVRLCQTFSTTMSR